VNRGISPVGKEKVYGGNDLVKRNEMKKAVPTALTGALGSKNTNYNSK